LALDVEMLTVGPIAENAFLVRPQGGDKLVVVDPGEEPERLLAAIEAMGAEVDAILLTHTHFDHVGAVAPLARATGAPSPSRASARTRTGTPGRPSPAARRWSSLG
jgi:hydroxyacylglutathione hydrolase